MILRPSYIEAIAPFIDQPLVKILAGVRRCGKSTIFEMLADELRRRGVPEDRIIKKRYTEMDIPADISAKDMYDDLKLQIQGKGRCYLLLDEIQEVKGWEKTVNSLLEGADVDIYVTGSNSKLMSSEISTYLTGRYVSIPVYPLSFREFLDFIEPYAGQMVQQAPRDSCQVPLVAPGLEGRVGPALRRLFLDQLHSKRPVVVLQTEVKERTLQDGLLAPGDPQVRTGLAEIGEHPQEVAGEGVQDLLLYKLRGQVIEDLVAARQLPVVQIAQEPGLGGAVRVAVLMAEYMDVIVVDEIEALIFSEHAAVADTQVNHSFSFEISM